MAATLLCPQISRKRFALCFFPSSFCQLSVAWVAHDFPSPWDSSCQGHPWAASCRTWRTGFRPPFSRGLSVYYCRPLSPLASSIWFFSLGYFLFHCLPVLCHFCGFFFNPPFWGHLCHFTPHITKFGWLILLNVPVFNHDSQGHPTKGTLSRVTLMASFLVSWLSLGPNSVSSMLCKVCFWKCESHGHLIVLKTKQDTKPSKACHCPLDTGLIKALCFLASDLLRLSATCRLCWRQFLMFTLQVIVY